MEGPPAQAAAALEPADVLVDWMRGRSTTWYRVRVNLTHVPEAERPPQEALDPDYDPLTEYPEADREAWLERSNRTLKAAEAAKATKASGTVEVPATDDANGSPDRS